MYVYIYIYIYVYIEREFTHVYVYIYIHVHTHMLQKWHNYLEGCDFYRQLTSLQSNGCGPLPKSLDTPGLSQNEINLRNKIWTETPPRHTPWRVIHSITVFHSASLRKEQKSQTQVYLFLSHNVWIGNLSRPDVRFTSLFTCRNWEMGTERDTARSFTMTMRYLFLLLRPS